MRGKGDGDCYTMNDFAGKLENFWNVFMNAGGYREVLKGLQNTLTIAEIGRAHV